MGKRSAVVELFLGDMGSMQRELRPSTQREDQLTMETKLEQIAVKAVNQLPKSVVREIRTPRSVGAGGGRPPPATRWGEEKSSSLPRPNSPTKDAFETRIEGAASGRDDAYQWPCGSEKILNGARSPAQLLVADGPAKHPGDLECNDVGLSAQRHRLGQHVENQEAENVAGHESQRDTCDIFDNFAPFYPRSGNDGHVVVESGYSEHACHG